MLFGTVLVALLTLCDASAVVRGPLLEHDDLSGGFCEECKEVELESLSLSSVKRLYNKHYVALRYIRERMKNRVNGERDFQPQFDDTEAEIIALLILETKPRNIYEFSPCAGYSTGVLLDSLSLINSGDAHVRSFDIHNTSYVNWIEEGVPQNVHWHFHLGDVRDQYSQWPLGDIDMLFIDSDHRAGFAQTYINDLLVPLISHVRDSRKKVVVSVHDVWHCLENGGWEFGCPSDEGNLVLAFLQEYGIDYFTAGWSRGSYPALVEEKRRLGLDEILSQSWGIDQLEYQVNSAIFFILH